MKIVFDSNVLISAFATVGTSKEVFEYCALSHTVISSPYILNEILRGLTKKLKFQLQEAMGVIGFLKKFISIVSPRATGLIKFQDNKDIPLLELIQEVEADIFITGDKKLLDLKRWGKTKIISPSGFWKVEKELM